MENSKSQNPRLLLKLLIVAWVLGRPEFIKQILDLDSCRRASVARYIRENVSMEKMQEEV